GTTVVWVYVRDAYDNVDSCSVQLIPEDNIPPVLNGPFPTDTTINCDALIPVPIVMTATDNCGTPNIDVDDDITNGSCPNSYVITRTYTATDGAGLTDSYIQIITVRDTVAPIFDVATLPSDTTVNCDAIPGVVTLSLSATDNCSASSDIVFNVVETSTQGAVGTCS